MPSCQLTLALIICDYFNMRSDTFRIITIPAALKPRTGLLWFWLAVLFLIPLFPLTDFVWHPHWDAIHWIPFQDFSFTMNMLMDIIGNIGWFMIFGYLLHYWMDEESSSFRSIATVALIAAGVSLSLEFFQIFCHNRVPSMTDVVCDTIGGCLGAYFSEQHRSTDSPEPVRYLVIEEDGSKTLL
jgi:glycopeptide antibiotics resistance protein